MKPAEPLLAGGWRARLRLGFDREEDRTRLAVRAHEGPLMVQKPLYPEGPSLCQVIVVHPPGGVAGGDELEIDLTASPGAKVQVTTPGAAKWYRGFDRIATQRTRLALQGGSLCEWLPQEAIIFDGAHADLDHEVLLDDGATYCGWEFTCLGRPLSAAPFLSGRLSQCTRIVRGGVPLFRERAAFEAGAPMLGADTVLGGHCAYGTLTIAGQQVPASLMERAREIVNGCPLAGVTAMDWLLVARWVGDRIEDGRALFTSLWAALRPWYAQRMAVVPRIWAT
jgi:urease accessory protein